jgi:hypothetical protein
MWNLKYLRIYGYTHYVTILDRLLVLPNLRLETHGFGSTPVRSISCEQGRVSENGVREQLGFLFHYLGFVKFIFPLNLISVTCPLYLLDPRQRLFIAFGLCLSTHRFHVSERLACAAMVITS